MYLILSREGFYTGSEYLDGVALLESSYIDHRKDTVYSPISYQIWPKPRLVKGINVADKKTVTTIDIAAQGPLQQNKGTPRIWVRWWRRESIVNDSSEASTSVGSDAFRTSVKVLCLFSPYQRLELIGWYSIKARRWYQGAVRPSRLNDHLRT